MEGHVQRCVERYFELANKKVEQFYKVSSLALGDHQSKQGGFESDWDLAEVRSHIVLKCLYLARIGRFDILWSVNKFARSVTKWTQACDRRLPRLISCTHHTNDIRHNCHVVNTALHCRMGLFQDSGSVGDIEDSKSTSGGVLFFCKQNMCSSHLDVQETDRSFTQLNRIWNHFFGCWILYGWVICSRFFGNNDWSSTFNQQQCPTQTFEHTGSWRSSFQNQEMTEGWSFEWCG